MNHNPVVQAPTDIPDDPMLASLVMGDIDIVGHLAFSLYCECKEEWRAAFIKAYGREPNAHETAVYELGELTARRKLTYRFLADARLTGAYVNIRRSTPKHAFIQNNYARCAKAAISRHPVLLDSMVSWGRRFGILLALALGTVLPFTRRLLP